MKLRSGHDLGKVKALLIQAALACADVSVISASIVISVLLRYDTLPWREVYGSHVAAHSISILAAVAVYVYTFSHYRLYRCAWRFAGLEMLWAVLKTNTFGVIALAGAQMLIDGEVFSRSVLVMQWTFGVLLTGGIRLALRVLSSARSFGKEGTHPGHQAPRRAVILGAGANGARILRTIREDPSLQYDVVGFLDDDQSKHGIYIQNVEVLGPLDRIKEMVSECALDEAIVAVPNIEDRRLRDYVMECRRRKLPVKLVPHITDVLNGQCPVRLVDFEVEDLLRRDCADVNIGALGKYLAGKRVLVTGAGGSIGSELCRQIISMDPESLTLLGHGENSIHQIYMELQHSHPNMAKRVSYVIASVANQPRIEQIFREHRPEVVFHAAAHKHVPMMETNEQEAVQNNVLGTYYITEACGKSGVERMVLISTDKAADPCSIMGATKRLCEEMLMCGASLWPKTCYVTVRFGNVLGSRGSVVSVFRKQIERGGPVTITHPDMTRYFMTIPEAVRLVLQAGSVGKSGALYLLEMGKPVKVLDLAKDMIRLSGFEPGSDIKVEFTGIRPGEKMHEKLTSADERIEKTRWEGLTLIRRPNYLSPEVVGAVIERLKRVSTYGTAAETRRMLLEMVPGCVEQIEEASHREPTEVVVKAPAQAI